MSGLNNFKYRFTADRNHIAVFPFVQITGIVVKSNKRKTGED
ncbi:hypothetical protein B4140_1840 [Bacillus amyloliquefaciens]|nr:hypothetical protein B4140_1840 [Bacillus amyloliquefaciens]